MPNGRMSRETFLVRTYENGDDNPVDNFYRLPQWEKYDIEEVNVCPEGVVLINWHDAEDLAKMLKGKSNNIIDVIRQMSEANERQKSD